MSSSRTSTEGDRHRPRAGAPTTQFHVLSFEGPDSYAQAGGLSTRATGLANAVAGLGFETHLWFVGDPSLPGEEARGFLTLHRWCQWISTYHSGGVYDGEEAKRRDLAGSLPPFLFAEFLLPHLQTAGSRAVVLAEEWHTVDAVLHLDGLLRLNGLRDRVVVFWNANNMFGLEHIDWHRLSRAAVITTVSRYMRYRMWALGVDPLIVPNGLPPDAFDPPDREVLAAIRRRFRDRLVLTKVARWDPDKRWILAIDTVAELKRLGKRPLLIARGGVEPHQFDVLARADSLGLRVAHRESPPDGARGLLESLSGAEPFDIINLVSPLTGAARRILFQVSDAVLANSGHEPFGLVGLEAMAAEGLACTGGTGEDYAVPGWNALVLQSTDPQEFIRFYFNLRADGAGLHATRRRGLATARQYDWHSILERNLLPRLELHAGAR